MKRRSISECRQEGVDAIVETSMSFSNTLYAKAFELFNRDEPFDVKTVGAIQKFHVFKAMRTNDGDIIETKKGWQVQVQVDWQDTSTRNTIVFKPQFNVNRSIETAVAALDKAKPPPHDRAAKRLAEFIVGRRLRVFYTSVDTDGTAKTKQSKSGDTVERRISFEGVIEAVDDICNSERPGKSVTVKFEPRHGYGVTYQTLEVFGNADDDIFFLHEKNDDQVVQE